MMSAYGEFRDVFSGMDDNRIVVYGLRYYIQQFVERAIGDDDTVYAENFYKKHGVKESPYSFPKEMFEQIKADGGRLPVKIEALPEGSVVYPHTPVFIITAEKKYSHFCTFLETILTMVWYPSCVATLSRHTRALIEDAFRTYVDSASYWKIDSRLHDFGFRGCTCVEQSVLGGSAHLLNFSGSDTMSACSYVQFRLNEGRPVGNSIPATEHSVMTSWPNEAAALLNLIVAHPGQIIACVMDAYNYDAALENILPLVKDAVYAYECFLVIRPDSGDPVDQVVKALRACVKADFKRALNTKNMVVFENVSVIQGDGIGYKVVKKILAAVVNAGFSPENVAFGMGGGLLQKVNRDTMSFATKLSYIEYDRPGCEKLYKARIDDLTSRGLTKAAAVFKEAFDESGKFKFEEYRDVMKSPETDAGKTSLPGRLKVLKCKQENGQFGPCTVYPLEVAEELLSKSPDQYKNAMITVYDHGKVDDTITAYRKESFDSIKARVDNEWKSVAAHGDALHKTLQDKHDRIREQIRKATGSSVDKGRRTLKSKVERVLEQLTELTRAVELFD